MQAIENGEGSHGDEDGTRVRAQTEGVEQVFHRRTVLGAYEENADEAEEDADGGDEHRCDDCSELHVAGTHGKGRGAESCRGEDAAAIALIEVSAHAGHVTDVVAHVVGDGCRVARVVFGDVSFHLSHEVGADISRLGVYAATDTCEESLCGSAHAEGEHCRGDGDECGMRIHVAIESMENQKPHGDVEQAESYDDEPHDSAGAKRDLQSFVQSFACRVGRTPTGVGSRLHAEESGKSTEETAREEGKRHPRVLGIEAVGHDGEDDSQHDKHDEHHPVLLSQIGHRTPTDVEGDLLHARRALVFLHHVTEEQPSHHQGTDRGQRDEPKDNR